MAEVVTVDSVTEELQKLVTEKAEALDTLNIAINEHVTLKNKYVTMSNELRLKPDQIKEDLGLGKAPTEKQQQAYIDDNLKELVQDLRISEENVKSWKREVDLLDDKISVEKLRVNLFRELLGAQNYD